MSLYAVFIVIYFWFGNLCNIFLSYFKHLFFLAYIILLNDFM